MHNLNFDSLKNIKLSISLSVLIAVVTAVYYVGGWANDQYVGWHDGRYALRVDVLTMAQVEPMQRQLDETQKTANETAKTVDKIAIQLEFMQRDAAITAANTTLSGFKEDLDRLEQNPENSRAWHMEKARLSNAITNATDYRNCLMVSTEGACRGLRNW